MPSDHYRHQTTNNFEKLLEQEDGKNTLKVNIPILLTIGMHIRPTRFLEVGPPNAQYDVRGRLRKRCTDVDWGDDGEIKEAMAADNNKDDDEEDPQKKNKQLKKEKQRLKQAATRARACQQSDQDNDKAAAVADFPISPPRISCGWRWLFRSSCPPTGPL